MFERFTQRAIKVMILAQVESGRLNHNFIGTEHILLALMGEGTSIAAIALKSEGVSLKDGRREVEIMIGRGSNIVAAKTSFTPTAKRILELCVKEAGQQKRQSIGTEHLLLGLIQEGESVAVSVLQNLGVDLQNLRNFIIQNMSELGDVKSDKMQPEDS
ncbi:Clp protease N-terminal domain-containing protein [Allocoleopsis sp.]|uniref:Clp protease N-terminal domain-containing protein n=1 Tax=Allocoleopsis sp. TaxID=3088169 RepID=UPI002FD469D6